MRSVLSFTRYRGIHAAARHSDRSLAFTAAVSARSRSDFLKTPAAARASNPYFPSNKRNCDELFATFNEGDMVSVKNKGIMKHDGDKSSSTIVGSSSSTIAAMFGTIIEERGGGWYTVRLRDNGRVIKQRASNLALVEVDNDFAVQQAGGLDEATPPLQSPDDDVAAAAFGKEEGGTKNQAANDQRATTKNSDRIIDLDRAMETSSLLPIGFEQGYLDQCRNHASYSKWIVFTDLHVAPSTLQTCLQVLENVYSLAKDRGAGIMFLGDFWHHRGTVRIDCLNAVLSKMSCWDVPMIMIPGNHDQVTLGGLDHGLTPLQYAYRVPAVNPSPGQEESFPGPLIFSYPTKFKNGFFIPYIRNSAKFRKILKSPESVTSKGLFVHADVTGALMNDQMTCQSGVGPDAFPPNIPIYSGHFHKPHNVTAPLSAPGVSIWYLGSPYETSLSEAGQTKALVVLDASLDWSCVETIPLNLGRKHFRFHSMNTFLNSPFLHARTDEIVTNDVDNYVPPVEGDRIVLSVSGQDLAVHRRSVESNSGTYSEFDKRVSELRKRGVKVEIRELKENVFTENKAEKATDKAISVAEDMPVKDTFTTFVKAEESRGNLKAKLVPIILERGLETIEEILNPENATEEDPLMMSAYSRESSSTTTDLILEKVTVEGFGSFRRKVCYPLDNRGLVLLRGSNKDGGADSNGSGKRYVVHQNKCDFLSS